MATAVNPLRVDGRRSAANVQVCGWGHPPVSHHQVVPFNDARSVGDTRLTTRHPGRRDRTTAREILCQAVERGHRRIKACADGADQWGTTGREAGLRYSAGRAQRGRVVPFRCYGRYTSGAVAGITTDASEAPSALADGAEARGSEQSERKLAVSAISEGDSNLRRRRSRAAAQYPQPSTPNPSPIKPARSVSNNRVNTPPSRDRKWRSAGRKNEGFSMASKGCGVPTGYADGRHRCRHHRRH